MAKGISEWGRQIVDQYPTAADLQLADTKAKRDVFRFIRLWLTEGIPFVFQEVPMVYEYGREILGQRIGVHPKDISMVGSARIGYSLAPNKFGQEFSRSRSDLDMFIISENWLNILSHEFTEFSEDYNRGTIIPRNDREKIFWDRNVIDVQNNLKSGFINSDRIPSFNRYVKTCEILNAAYIFKVQVNQESGGDLVRKATIRVYRDWDVAVRQIGGTLWGTLQTIREAMAAVERE